MYVLTWFHHTNLLQQLAGVYQLCPTRHQGHCRSNSVLLTMAIRRCQQPHSPSRVAPQDPQYDDDRVGQAHQRLGWAKETKPFAVVTVTVNYSNLVDKTSKGT